jgi:hypothetical protein
MAYIVQHSIVQAGVAGMHWQSHRNEDDIRQAAEVLNAGTKIAGTVLKDKMRELI